MAVRLAASALACLAVLATTGCTGRAPDGAPTVLRVVFPAAPVTLDPHHHQDRVTSAILGNVYEGLVQTDADLRLTPALASGWESLDDRTWRFDLRADVVFHDGHPLAAADVVSSLERARRVRGMSVADSLHTVATVRAVAPLVVEVQTTSPDPVLLNKLVHVAIVRQGPGGSLSGTGPFRPTTGLEEGASTLELARFADYWGSTPVWDELELRFVPDADRQVDMLVRGATDLIAWLPQATAGSLAGTPGIDVRTRPGLSAFFLAMDLSQPPFDDVRVRRAIDLALDRARFVDVAMEGVGEPLAQLAPRMVFGHAEAVAPRPPDRSRSRALLEEAGLALPLELHLAAVPGMEPDAAEIASQLREVGVAVEAEIVPWEELYPRIARREVSAVLIGFACDTGDAGDVYDTVLHSPGEGYGTSNFLGYANPRLDDVIERAGATLDARERKRLFAVAAEIVAHELPLVPLASKHALSAVRHDLEWTPRLDRRILAVEVRPGRTRESGRR